MIKPTFGPECMGGHPGLRFLPWVFTLVQARKTGRWSVKRWLNFSILRAEHLVLFHQLLSIPLVIVVGLWLIAWIVNCLILVSTWHLVSIPVRPVIVTVLIEIKFPFFGCWHWSIFVIRSALGHRISLVLVSPHLSVFIFDFALLESWLFIGLYSIDFSKVRRHPLRDILFGCYRVIKPSEVIFFVIRVRHLIRVYPGGALPRPLAPGVSSYIERLLLVSNILRLQINDLSDRAGTDRIDLLIFALQNLIF